ncbi:hypothetical protein [Arthrobacter sp. 18067]|uniref:hypothetical protein n=1 Tax=Arthrobacter sp. 18067 TaxID=2681413 RepID=UPI001356D8B4|nr:hypothetical protein [Arthrobacter sp. 18067]
MGFMNALDVDAQELTDAVDRNSREVIEYFIQHGRERSRDELERYRQASLFEALTRQGWVPPTLAQLATTRIREVMNGEANSIAESLCNAIELLAPEPEEIVVDDRGAEPLAEWERELLESAAAE